MPLIPGTLAAIRHVAMQGRLVFAGRDHKEQAYHEGVSRLVRLAEILEKAGQNPASQVRIDGASGVATITFQHGEFMEIVGILASLTPRPIA